MADAATSADRVEERLGSRVELADTTAGADTLRRVLARRTHRRYADRPVPEDLLQALFACAFSASAKSDLQQSGVRSEERRVGKEWVSTCRSRWSPAH